MNILLTGGAGYIGSHTALSLIDNGHSVTVIDNLITGNKALIPSKVKHYNFDISDEISIKKILKENRFDIVMHFAGLTRVEESVKYPEKYQLHNFEKSKIFFLLCIKNNLKKIIFSSSAGVYGNSNSSNLTEDSELKPINPYAESKYKIENFLIEISKKDKVDYTILRYFNAIGAPRPPLEEDAVVDRGRLLREQRRQRGARHDRAAAAARIGRRVGAIAVGAAAQESGAGELGAVFAPASGAADSVVAPVDR